MYNNKLTNFSYGDAKRDQLLKSFGADTFDLIKGGKLDTSHLVLKEVSVGGKMMHRWVDPHKGDKEHAEHGSKIEFEHKGSKVKGTVGGVMKTGEYAIKGEDGKAYAKHPHQFDSPHDTSEKDVSTSEGTKKSPKDWAADSSEEVLTAALAKKDLPADHRKIAEDELKTRGTSKDATDKTKSPESKGKGTTEPKASAKEVKKLDEEADDAVDINAKFKVYEKFVRMVAKGTVKSGIAYGTGGVGKTYTATKALEKTINPKTGKPMKAFNSDTDTPGEDGYDYVKITGKATTSGVIQALWEHNGKMLLFDDCDAVLKDENTVNMFKGALDSTGDGQISALSARPLKDSTGAAIPSTFKFNGRAFFISNLSSKEIPQPIKSRSLRVDLSMDAQQTIDRIKNIAEDKQGKLTNITLEDASGGKISYTHEDMDAAIKFLEKYKDKTGDLNVRTLGNIVRVIHDAREEGEDEGDWVDAAKSFILSKSIDEPIDSIIPGAAAVFEQILEIPDEVEKAFQFILEVEDPIEKAFESILSVDEEKINKAFDIVLL